MNNLEKTLSRVLEDQKRFKTPFTTAGLKIKLFGKTILHWWRSPKHFLVDFESDFFSDCKEDLSKTTKQFKKGTYSYFYQKRAKLCKFQYFLRETVTRFFRHNLYLPIIWKIEELQNLYRGFLNPSNVLTLKDLCPYEWHGAEEYILHSNFALFKEYIITREFFDKHDYDFIPWAEAEADYKDHFNKRSYESFFKQRAKFKQACVDCNNWFSKERPELIKNTDLELTKANKKGRRLKTKEAVTKNYSKHRQMEELLEKTDTKWLKWIVENRSRFQS